MSLDLCTKKKKEKKISLSYGGLKKIIKILLVFKSTNDTITHHVTLINTRPN